MNDITVAMCLLFTVLFMLFVGLISLHLVERMWAG